MASQSTALCLVPKTEGEPDAPPKHEQPALRGEGAPGGPAEPRKEGEPQHGDAIDEKELQRQLLEKKHEFMLQRASCARLQARSMRTSAEVAELAARLADAETGRYSRAGGNLTDLQRIAAQRARARAQRELARADAHDARAREIEGVAKRMASRLKVNGAAGATDAGSESDEKE